MIDIEERKHISFEYGRRLREEKLRNGILSLSSQGLVGQDLKQIFANLSKKEEANDCTEPPQKRRRIRGKEAFIARLSTASNIVEVDLSYNNQMGAAGMTYLRLMPTQIHTLHLNNCGLSLAAFRTVCEFLETNTSVLVIGLGDLMMSDEKAECVGDLLEKNRTIEDLSITGNSHMGVGKEGFRHLGRGLMKNKTLKRFGYFHKMDHEALLYFASVILDGGGAGLESFRILTSTYDISKEFKTLVVPKFESVLEKFEKLQDLGTDSKKVWGPGIHYWLEMNTLRTRKITREGTMHDFTSTLEKAAKRKSYDAIYYMLQNNARHLK